MTQIEEGTGGKGCWKVLDMKRIDELDKEEMGREVVRQQRAQRTDDRNWGCGNYGRKSWKERFHLMTERSDLL